MVHNIWSIAYGPYIIFHSVKRIGLNGNVKGLGNRNRLNLSIFIQMTMNDFAEKQYRTPRDWVDIVDAIIQHCNGDHSSCSLLTRFMGYILWNTKFDLNYLYLTFIWPFKDATMTRNSATACSSSWLILTKNQKPKLWSKKWAKTYANFWLVTIKKIWVMCYVASVIHLIMKQITPEL